MRASEIIRGVLDLIDQVECGQTTPTTVIHIGQEATPPVEVVEPEVVEPTPVDAPQDDEHRRFIQILDILSAKPHQTYDNSPGEAYANADAVTTKAGGGWNGPKNPADIRANSVSMYPNYQHKPGK